MSVDPPIVESAEVVLMFGIAGSGKTTYARALERLGFERLSIDEGLWRRFGRYDVDYAAARYAELAVLVEQDWQERLVPLVKHGRNVVVDFSFWRRATRDRYKGLIEQAGGIRRLIYIKIDPTELRRRMTGRRWRFDANAAFPITEEILDRYLNDFQESRGEGEEVLAPYVDPCGTTTIKAVTARSPAADVPFAVRLARSYRPLSGWLAGSAL